MVSYLPSDVAARPANSVLAAPNWLQRNVTLDPWQIVKNYWRKSHLSHEVMEQLYQMSDRLHGHDFGRIAHSTARSILRRPANWLDATLDLIRLGLTHNDTSLVWRETRRDLLQLLDLPLGVRRGRGWKRATGHFYQQMVMPALTEIGHPVSSLSIWKLYNMGFVAKGRQATVGFDIHPGWHFAKPLSVEQQMRLIESLDVLFISHPHADHLHRGFAERFLASGKPMVIPNRPNWAYHDNVITLDKTWQQAQRIGGVRFHAYRGLQKPITRNAVYAVEIDGQTIVHTGDNELNSVYYDVRQAHTIDLLLGNVWTGLADTAHILRPRQLVVGHENEVRHPGPTCVPYRKTFDEIDAMTVRADFPLPPAYVMSWGESMVSVPQPAAAIDRLALAR